MRAHRPPATDAGVAARARAAVGLSEQARPDELLVDVPLVALGKRLVEQLGDLVEMGLPLLAVALELVEVDEPLAAAQLAAADLLHLVAEEARLGIGGGLGGVPVVLVADEAVRSGGGRLDADLQGAVFLLRRLGEADEQVAVGAVGQDDVAVEVLLAESA